MKQKHTPTPWRYMKVEKSYTCHDGRVVTVATVFQGDTAIARCHNVADAAFIVKACNAHDELVAALETAETYFDQYAAETPASEHTLIHIRAALAKARSTT